MIENNRPTRGTDLEMVRQTLGFSVGEVITEFGLSGMNRWMSLAKQGADAVIKDPSLALLVRHLDLNPEITWLPRPGELVKEMYELVNRLLLAGKYLKETDTEAKKQRTFSLLLGSEETGAYRWIEKKQRASPAVMRLLYLLKQKLTGVNDSDGYKILSDWMDVVRAEANARGVEGDIFKNPKVKSKSRWNQEISETKKTNKSDEG